MTAPTSALPSLSSSPLAREVPPASAARPCRVEIATEFAPLEAEWRELEAAGASSPYQRFDWVAAYGSALSAAEGFACRAVALRDDDGRLLLLLPLEVRRAWGGWVGSIIGGKHANFHLPLVAPGLSQRIGAADLRALLVEAGRRLGLDAYAFVNMPRAWRGEPNPLAAEGRPSPSNGYSLKLAADAEATLARALSKDARKKLRKKEKTLGELGPVAYRLARTPEEVETILAAFLRHKRDRFRELGIVNPFEDPAIQAFLRQGCLAGLQHGQPAVELHALMAGDRIAAVFGVAADRWRCSGMFIAFDPEAGRSSPGDILLARVIGAQCEAGRETFDLGVGEARYKSSLCDEAEELVDTVLPVTWRGYAYAAGSQWLRYAKRRVKQTPWVWALVGEARRLKGRIASRAGA